MEDMISKDQVEVILFNANTLELAKLTLATISAEDIAAAATGYGGLLDPIGQLRQFIATQLGYFASFIINNVGPVVQSAVDAVIGGIKSTITSIYNTVINLPRMITDAVNTIMNAVKGLEGAVNKFWSTIQNTVVKYLTTTINELRKLITEDIPRFITSELPKMLSEAATAAVSALQSAINALLSAISNAAKSAAEIVERIEGALEQALRSAQEMINKYVVEPAKSALKQLMEMPRVIEDLIMKVPGMIGDVVADVMNTLKRSIDAVAELVEELPAKLSEAVNAVSRLLGELAKLPEAARAIVDAFAKQLEERLLKPFQEKYIKPWSEALKDPSKIFSMIAEHVRDVLETIEKQIETLAKLANLPKAIEDMGKVLSQLGANFTGFINAVLNIYNWLKENIPKEIKDFIKSGAEFFKELPDKLGEALSKALSSAAEQLIKGTEWLAARLNEAMKWLSAQLQAIAQAVWGALRAAWKAVVDAIAGAAQLGSSIVKGILDVTVLGFFKQAMEGLKEAVEKAAVGELGGELSAAEAMLAAWAAHAALMHGAAAALKGAGEAIGDQEVAVEPLGLGVKLRIKLGRLLAAAGEALSTVVKDLGLAVVVGLGIWSFEPVKRLLAQYWRKVLPVELPSISDMKTMVQRSMATGEYEDMVKTMKQVMAMYGYQDWVIDWFIRSPEELAIKFRDRFGYERTLPLAMVYSMPSPSDLCRMMVRDLFMNVTEFANVMKAQGFVPDIAYMYYFMHFKYPSPTALWEFVCRAAADFLWFKPSPEDVAEAKQEAQLVKAFEPVPPTELNVSKTKDLKLHFTALARYMKWHDYARFSWIKGWTSDNWLVINMLVDLPGRIDARWMYKWMIIQEFGAKKFTEQPPREVISIEDVTNVARIEIARGMHPLWVPYVAVAEAMNALTEERTLVRTGFMNAFKEGAMTLKDVDELMKGFFKVGFKVKVWNPDRMVYEDRFCEHPVAFLPGERALIELRAVFDKAVDLVRDFARTLVFAVRELIYAPGEAVEKLKETLKLINDSFFVAEVKQATGRELRLSLDEGYAKCLAELGALLQDIYVIERARYYMRYIIYRIMYRFAQGYITRDEAMKFIDEALKLCRESPLIKDLFMMSADLMMSEFVRRTLARATIRKYARGVIGFEDALKQLTALGLDREVAEALLEAEVRAYIPTVHQVATLAELVPEARQLLPEVFEIRGVPEHHRPYWEKYVERAPLRDEINMFRTRVREALRYGVDVAQVFTDQVERKIKELWGRLGKLLSPYGIEEKELALLYRTALLERMIEEAREAERESIPTPSQVATLAEVVPEARRLLDEVLEKRRVPEEWRPVWRKYVLIRPWFDEIRRYVTELINDYATGTITEREFMEELSALKEFGYEKEEIKYIIKIAKLRRRRYERRRQRRSARRGGGR